MEEQAEKKEKTSNIFSVVFIVLVFIGLVIYIVCTDGFENIINVLTTADYTWVLVGVLFLAIEWGLEALALHIPLKNMYPKHTYMLSLKSNIVGRMFNNITPFSSGGQPFQAYVLSKRGLKASDTFSVLMMRYVVYQIALFSWAFILMATNFQFFSETFGDYIWLVLLGFFMNLIATVFIIVAGVKKEFILRVANGIVKGIAKIRFKEHRIIKDIDNALVKVDESVSNYSEQFNVMRGQWGTLFKMYVISMFQLLAYFAIPYTIYMSFGNTGVQFFQVITIQAFLLLVMSFIPTPGSGLGAEGGFALFYNGIFVSGLNMAILFWRLYTFYVPIIVGAIVFTLIKKNRDEKQKN